MVKGIHGLPCSQLFQWIVSSGLLASSAASASRSLLVDRASQNPPDLFFQAASIFFGAAAQLFLYPAFNVANHKLGQDELLSV